MTDIHAAIKAGIADTKGKVDLMVGRGLVTAVSDAGAIQVMQLLLLDGEPADDVERIQEYGFTSVPKAGAEVACVFVGGNRDHGLVIAVDDRRYRLVGLEGGEVAIFDDQGQKVHLTRSGIVIDGGGLPIKITNTPEVDVDSPLLKTTGDVQVGGTIHAVGAISSDSDISDHGNKSMAAMRGVYNGHDHSNPEGGRVGKDQGKM